MSARFEMGTVPRQLATFAVAAAIALIPAATHAAPPLTQPGPAPSVSARAAAPVDQAQAPTAQKPRTATAPKTPAAAAPAAQTPTEYALAGTQVLPIHSSITGQDYVLQIALPRGYDSGAGRYPVIYSVDGQWDFHLVNALNGQLYYDGFLPAAIQVGITWGGPNPNYDQRRAFDLTPTPAGRPTQYGNAAKFLEFIQKEAIPFVESRFRTQTDERTLTGSSFGGIFTLFALFRQPGLFNRYVLTSPAWTFDNGSIYGIAAEFGKLQLPRPVKLFMAVGEYEDVVGFEKLASTIKAYNLAGLDVRSQVVMGSGHASAKAEGYTRGLQFVFERPCGAASADALQRIAGTYQLVQADLAVKFEVESGKLVAYPPGNTKTVFCAVSDLEYRVVGQYFRLTFDQGADKAITGFTLEQYSNTMTAKRVQ